MCINDRDLREPAVSLGHDCHTNREIDIFRPVGGPGGYEQNGIAEPLEHYLH